MAHSLDIIGDRWALLVVRELRLGPKRFADLQASLPNAGPTVLAQRLRELAQAGVLRRRTLPPPAASKVYELTGWGAELEPVFAALARWGMRSPVPRAGLLSADSVLLGLRTFFRSDGPPWTATYQVDLGRDGYRIRVADGALVELARGGATGPVDATLTADDQLVLHRLLGGEDTLEAAVGRGELTLTGDPRLVRRLLAAVDKQAAAPS